MSEQVLDDTTLTINNDEANNIVHENRSNSTNASNVASISKSDIPATISSTKKTVPARKINIRSKNGSYERISGSIFSSLLQQIGPHIEKLDTNYRAAIPIEKRLACALYALGSSIDKFFHRLIKFPNTDAEIQDTIDGVFIKWGYPLCIGALDSTHIAIKPPLGFEVDYFNYKKYHSIIML
ncbi:unnamed protein product [Rotaria magnacalcarata]